MRALAAAHLRLLPPDPNPEHEDTQINRKTYVIEARECEPRVKVERLECKFLLRKKVATIVSVAVCLAFCIATSSQQLLFSSPAQSSRNSALQARPTTIFNSREFSSASVPNTQVSTWRSHHFGPPSTSTTAGAAHATEARGALSRNFYSSSSTRGARNATMTGGQNSWHFPRISPEHAAEVLLTGAQVINRIAQAETPLNYCRTPDDQDGECSDIRKCIWLVLDKARLKQSVCLRNLIIPAVCCPVSNANNTPIANMIQSTLEPVLFRPKAPKPKKQPVGPIPMRPLASIVNKTIVGMPPPSQVSMAVRQPPTSTTQAPSSASTSTTTTATTTTPTLAPSSQIFDSIKSQAEKPPEGSLNEPIKPSSSNTLFQDESPPQETHGNKVSNHYNRTVSQRYPWANETCGEGGRTRTGRIVGGSDSKLGQWPWMTAMYLNKRNAFSSSSSSAGEFWCGGALINRRFILTAAHCLSDQRGNRYKNDQVTIKLGGVDLVRHQAPLDILRNLELDSRSSSASSDLYSTPNPFAAIEQQHQAAPVRRSARQPNAARSDNNGRQSLMQSRNEDEEEEFSWTSFITKALGLTGLTSSSSSASASSSSPMPASSLTASSASLNSNDGSTKSLSDQTRKQQLAAHARKTYFKEYKVANIKQHPKFQRHGFYNDIGLIELKSDVEYDDLISPICLPTEHDLKRDLTGFMATVLGWGTLSYGGQGSKMLQQVSMPVWNNKDCDERYLQHIGKSFLCAGFLTGGKDACQGDSGGPLMVSDNSGRWTLHGVVSFGKTCAQAGYPGVYTRVTEYLDWIRDNTDLDGYSASGNSRHQRKI